MPIFGISVAGLNVNDKTYSCIFIIIPKLNKNCILGINILKMFKGRINVEENYIMLRNEDKESKIEFIDDEKKRIRIIHEINMEPNDGLMNIDPHDCK